MTAATLLIVDQQAPPPDNLPALLKELSRQHRLDSYQCRQRLVGSGLSLLDQGEREALEGISPLLSEYGYRHWLVEPRQPESAPLRLRGLQIARDRMVLLCRERQVELPRGARVLAVLADMSGALADQSVKQLLSSRAYRGRDNVRYLSAHKILKTILRGEPLLDLYLLDPAGLIRGAVRVFPGKFDHRGLGELATASSRQNLDRLLKLVEEYAGEFTLKTDFGLVNLPGCTLRRGDPDDPEIQRRNQLSLTRYGWLMADLLRSGPRGDLQAAAGMLAGNIGGAGEPARPFEAPAPELPLPPALHRESRWRHPSFWFGSAGALLVAVGMIIVDGDSRVARQLYHYVFAAGATQLILSALMFWAGFYYLVLKRQIENIPTSKVRSIAMGMVEVKGQAIRQYSLVAPMSHIPCVYYRLGRYRRDSENQWVLKSLSSSASVPFFLEDESGRVCVDPAGCLVSAGSINEGTPGQLGYLPLSADSDEKWVEELIVEGTLLYVLGYADLKPDNGPDLKQRRIEALRELKRDPEKLRQFDADGDGRLDENEWEEARQAVDEQLCRDSLQTRRVRKKQEEQVVIRKRKGRPFIIAESPNEENLTGRYAHYTIPLLCGAVLCAGWGFHALLNYLG